MLTARPMIFNTVNNRFFHKCRSVVLRELFDTISSIKVIEYACAAIGLPVCQKALQQQSNRFYRPGIVRL